MMITINNSDLLPNSYKNHKVMDLNNGIHMRNT